MLAHPTTKRLVLLAVMGTIALSNAACLGKGKAPPPPPPMAAPVVRKG